MATRAIKVMVEGDATKLGKTTQEAAAHVSKMSAAIGGLAAAGGMAVFNMASEAVGNFVGQLGAAGDAFRADEESQMRLSNVMKNTYGPIYKQMTAYTEEFAGAQARLGFQDDDVRDSLAKMVGVTGNMREALDSVAIAQDLARAKNITLAEATDVITKANLDQGKALKGLGIDIGKAKTAAEILKVVQDQVKGSAEAWANTSAGKLAAANVKNAESWEKIGSIVNRVQSVVLPLAAEAFERLSNFAIEHLIPAFNQIWAVAQQLGKAFMELLAPAIKYIRDHFDSIKPVLIGLAIVVGVVIGAIILAIMAVIAIVVLLVAGFVAFNDNLGRILQDAQHKWLDFENLLIGGVRRIVASLNSIPGVNIPMPALQGYGGTQARGGRGGLQSFDSGGVVTGDYLGQRVMVQAKVGERFSMGGRSGGGEIHIHMDGIYAGDGPSLDLLANKIAQRLTYATGR